MGWWLINENGGIKNFADGRELQNAIPGEDDVENQYGGDGPADIMGPAVDRIIAEYKEAWKRPPSFEELVGILKFVTGPMELSGKLKAGPRLSLRELDVLEMTAKLDLDKKPERTQSNESWINGIVDAIEMARRYLKGVEPRDRNMRQTLAVHIFGAMLSYYESTPKENRNDVGLIDEIAAALAKVVETGNVPGAIRVLCCDASMSDAEKVKNIYNMACECI